MAARLPYGDYLEITGKLQQVRCSTISWSPQRYACTNIRFNPYFMTQTLPRSAVTVWGPSTTTVGTHYAHHPKSPPRTYTHPPTHRLNSLCCLPFSWLLLLLWLLHFGIRRTRSTSWTLKVICGSCQSGGVLRIGW